MATGDPAKPKAGSRAWSRPLGELVNAALDPLAAKRGFGESDLLLHWDEIVGPRLAAACQPMRLQWPARGPKTPPNAAPQPATLHVGVESAFALDLQHMAPMICERINARLGWKCVGRLSLRQGPVERLPARPRRRAAPDPAALARAQALTRDIEDEALRAALDRLGARALSAPPSKT